MASTNPTIDSADRLSFTVFLAVILHATLILGISFELNKHSPSGPVIEVTLAQHKSEQPPKQADFLAQHSQQGGGTLQEKALPTVTESVEFLQQLQQEISPEESAAQSAPNPQQSAAKVTTLSRSEYRAEKDSQTETDTSSQQNDPNTSLLERSLALASLDAKLDIREQLQTRDTRKRKITAASTLETADAYYVSQWVNKIHRVGKLNYPYEARRRNIYGDLHLAVTLLSDGSVKDIRVARSSGHKVLDDAAMRIVRLAEPFAPFPAALKKKYDELEITRKWVFSRDGRRPIL